MLSRGVSRIAFKRLQHTAAETTAPKAFNNKYNFNINPPPVHEYWNYRNASVLIAFVPIYFGVGYVTRYLSDNTEAFGGLVEFADSEKSPLKDLKFGEPQTKSK
ncbi:hypothetical protein DFJ63DRAFT_334257 [Scheffersomyces coipomensis]|uniref:uncharacterized protein n=1 Tax=Scheffersomyces coipomensis TaxID=1788519 RepID=UPI00315CB57A